MKFNFANPPDIERARAYLEELIVRRGIAEVKKVSPKRTLQQNRYLHLIINAFALHFGIRFDRAKFIYKNVNKSMYFRRFKVGEEVFLEVRSSATLTKDEMMKSIDRFREFSAEQGYPLPAATDQGWLMAVENAIEQQEYYL